MCSRHKRKFLPCKTLGKLHAGELLSPTTRRPWTGYQHGGLNTGDVFIARCDVWLLSRHHACIVVIVDLKWRTRDLSSFNSNIV